MFRLTSEYVPDMIAAMPLRNEIMLITYADSLGGNLRALAQVLENHFKDAIGGLHVLPFFPSSADRGFAPTRYDIVDEAFGTWEDIQLLSGRYDFMADFMINHISRASSYFEDFTNRKDSSPYADMFIRYKEFWEGGEPTQEQVDLIYKRKPRAPYVEVTFRDGTSEKVWCTFDSEQIDLDLRKEITWKFVTDSLLGLADRGVAVVRLDAFAYAAKKPGTSCFFVEPEMWDMLERARGILEPRGIEVLPEIHEHFSIQQKLADRGYWVYDFALPMLLLHTLFAGSNVRLLEWLRICPRKQFTTLDTHDGIGVVDVRGLLSDEEIEATREHLFTHGANVKRVYNTAAYNNLDIYQINCTYYSALGANDDAYLLSRAIQFFAPGIPQVYYVGLLAGANDIELIERTKTGRDINRHSYTVDEVNREVRRSIVQRLLRLMRFRNSCKAFSGTFQILPTQQVNELKLAWKSGEEVAMLSANLATFSFSVEFTDPQSGHLVELSLLE